MNLVWHDIPRPMTSEKEEKEYVHGICACDVPYGYSIKIPRTWSDNGVYNFRCEDCGLEGIVICHNILLERN